MDDETIKKWRKAGEIAATALKYGTTLMKPEVPVMEVLDKVEEKIQEMGGGIAFPAQSSLNDIAAHACEKNAEVVYKEGDVAKIDVGAHFDGYVADNATTIEIGGTDKYKELIKASRDALNNAIKILKPGVNTGEVGKTIQETIQQAGFNPIINLSGHGIGRWIVHKEPSMPNYDIGKGRIIEENTALAMEPFATTGEGLVRDKGEATVFMMRQKRPVRSQFARQLLTKINEYNGLPFTTRWLSKEFGEAKTKLGLNELQKANIIHAYPPLQERANGIVSQAEHCFIVGKKTIVLTQLDDWP